MEVVKAIFMEADPERCSWKWIQAMFKEVDKAIFKEVNEGDVHGPG